MNGSKKAERSLRRNAETHLTASHRQPAGGERERERAGTHTRPDRPAPGGGGPALLAVRSPRSDPPRHIGTPTIRCSAVG